MGQPGGYSDTEYIDAINVYYDVGYSTQDDLEDVIADVNDHRNGPARGRVLGWHPDYPGDLVEAPVEWFD